MTFAYSLELEYLGYESETKKERQNRKNLERYYENKKDPAWVEKEREKNKIRHQKNKQNPEIVLRRKLYSKEYRKKNIERLKQQDKIRDKKRWAALTPEQKEHNKATRNKEKINARAKIYRKENRELIRIRKKNNPKVKETQKTWRENNRDKTRANNRKAAKKPKKRIYTKLRGRFNRLFNKIAGPIKIGGTKNLTELTGDQLKAHIELQFSEGMTWENYGKVWQIDHIVPVSLADGDKEKFIRLNHFTNLQPLESSENARKRDVLEHKYITYDLYHRYKDLLPSSFPEPSDITWEMAILDPI